jgi:hypothetical protein
VKKYAKEAGKTFDKVVRIAPRPRAMPARSISLLSRRRLRLLLRRASPRVLHMDEEASARPRFSAACDSSSTPMMGSFDRGRPAGVDAGSDLRCSRADARRRA